MAITKKQDVQNLLDIGYVLYDVCSDYSLDLASDKGKELFIISEYRVNTVQIADMKVNLYTHIDYDELHYALAPEGLTGYRV